MASRSPSGLTDDRSIAKSTPQGLALALTTLVVLAVLGAKVYTGHVWEDFLFTFRNSENLVAGHGLLYQMGERTHSFTSPLNVLLPALFKALIPGEGYGAGLWGFTLVSVGVCGLGLWAYLKFVLGAGDRASRIEALVVALCLGLNVRLVVFSFAGQESGLWAGFLFLAFVALQRGGELSWRTLGISAAGLMWTRPDCCVHIVLLVLAAFVFPDRPRAELVRPFVKAAALAAVLYLPWFAWAWWYYGSPVPQTIFAKMGLYGPVSAGAKLAAFAKAFPDALGGAFAPIYADAGGWPAWVMWFARAAGLVCGAYWLLPTADRVGRFASFVFLGSAAYLALVGVSGVMYPWYFVPCVVFGVIALGRIVATSLRSGQMARTVFAYAAMSSMAVGLGYQSVYTLPQMKLRQTLVEDGVRKPVGLWLRDHQKPSETAMLEPAGYIGYYAGTHILDYPGLVSPRVVAARRKMQAGMWGAIVDLQPDWLVLRPNEAKAFMDVPIIGLSYDLVKIFDVRAEVYRYHDLPGYGFLSSDACFHIYRRKIHASAPAAR
ncbi:MAG TPA: hypothetical protein VHO24_16895 [Opitutaceae bacterium]|nr:hypothetical protein [Opitutaceae bacterium]